MGCAKSTSKDRPIQQVRVQKQYEHDPVQSPITVSKQYVDSKPKTPVIIENKGDILSTAGDKNDLKLNTQEIKRPSSDRHDGKSIEALL